VRTYRYRLEFQAPDDAAASRLVGALNSVISAASRVEIQLPLGLTAVDADLPYAVRKALPKRRRKSSA